MDIIDEITQQITKGNEDKIIKITHGEFDRPWAKWIGVFFALLSTSIVLLIIALFLKSLALYFSFVGLLPLSLIGLFISSHMDNRCRWINYELDSNDNKVNKRYGGRLCDQRTQKFKDEGGFLNNEKEVE